MDKLKSLQELKTKSYGLQEEREGLLGEHKQLELIDALMDKVVHQEEQMREEKQILIQQLRQVSEEMMQIGVLKKEIQSMKEKHQQTVQTMMEMTYDPLKLRVNELRSRHGLKELPARWQEELDLTMNAYLQERREGWNRESEMESQDHLLVRLKIKRKR